MKVLKQKYTCLFIFILIASGSSAQTDISGVWQGEISLDYLPQSPWFKFELTLKMDGKTISGISHVWAFDNHALMELEGEHVKGNIYRLKEIRLKDFTTATATGWEWCLKTMYLEYSTENGYPTLSGIWEGYTSFSDCKPGKLKVQKKPRA